MSIYEYSCPKCMIIMEHDFPFAEPEETVKCPDCNADIDQHFAGRQVPVHFKGAGWTGQNSATGYNKKGGSDEINLKLQEGCKDRMETGWHHYSRMTPNEALTDSARKLSAAELEDRLKTSKKQTEANYNKSGLSPYNKKRPSNT